MQRNNMYRENEKLSLDAFLANPEAELKQVQKEKRTLERRLKRAELLLEIPKKASELTRSSTFQNHLRHGIRPGLPDHVPIQSPECSRKRPGH